MYKKAHLISDFRKKVSPQLGLEPTNMRQNLKKSVSLKARVPGKCQVSFYPLYHKP